MAKNPQTASDTWHCCSRVNKQPVRMCYSRMFQQGSGAQKTVTLKPLMHTKWFRMPGWCVSNQVKWHLPYFSVMTPLSVSRIKSRHVTETPICKVNHTLLHIFSIILKRKKKTLKRKIEEFTFACCHQCAAGTTVQGSMCVNLWAGDYTDRRSLAHQVIIIQQGIPYYHSIHATYEATINNSIGHLPP